MKRYLTIAALLVWASLAWSQQEPLYSQYLFNKLAINPAYAGSRDQLSLVMQARRQWAGFSGAPSTELLTAHFPTPDLRHGFGMTLINDRWGHTSTTELSGAYAYRIPMGEEGNLALGLKAGVKTYRFGFDDVAIWDQGDIAFNAGNSYSKGVFVFAPAIYYQNANFYAGVSAGDLIPHRFELLQVGQGSKSALHVYTMAGAAIPLGTSVKLKPSILLRTVANAPVGLDATLAVGFVDRVTTGITWRPGNALAFLLQAHLTKSIQLGYSYDFGLNATRTLSSGSHELMLGFDLNFLQQDLDAPKVF